MSLHDDETRLRHMLDHAIEAIEMTHGRTRSDLDTKAGIPGNTGSRAGRPAPAATSRAYRTSPGEP